MLWLCPRGEIRPGHGAYFRHPTAIAPPSALTFSLLYWQIDRGCPHARASHLSVKPDWVFPQPATPEDLPPDWRPLFLDYLYLGYNTTAFSPTDALPLTHRAKMLMMIESTISLLTMVIILSRHQHYLELKGHG
jgi:hypothetical protein